MREYIVLHECVERGISLGWARAHKHHQQPTPGQIQAAITDAVMLSITEYFALDDEGANDRTFDKCTD